jgi:beta-lactamase regulating signal transducer with metallopeptidase domain
MIRLFINSTLQISTILLIGIAAMPFLRRQSAALRHCVLCSVMGVAMLLPVLTAILPAWHVSRPALLSVAAFPSENHPVSTVVAGKTFTPQDGSPVHPALPLVGIWYAGVAMGALVLMIGLLRLRMIRRSARSIVDGPWIEEMQAIAAQYRLCRPAQLFEADTQALLVTYGALHPKILLPPGASEWDDACIEAAVRHELAHVRRGDWLTQMLAQLCRIALWFNPLVWIVYRRMQLESELACDDAVLMSGIPGPLYAKSLLSLTHALNRSVHWFPAPGINGVTPLERRFSAMIAPDTNRQSVRAVTLVLIWTMALSVAVPLAALSYSPGIPSLPLVSAPLAVSASPSIPLPPPRASSIRPTKHSTPQQTAGRLVGTVTDASGRAVSGATVFVTRPFTAAELDEIEASRRKRDAAEIELSRSAELYRLGALTLRDVLQAQQRLLQATAAELSARPDGLRAGVDIKPVTTDLAGAFVVPDLAPGIYGIQVFAVEFASYPAGNIVIQSSADTRQDFRLTIPLTSAAVAQPPAVFVVPPAADLAHPAKYSGERISLSAGNMDLKDFLRFIADVSGLNVLLDPGLDATVTAEFHDIPWDQALDLVLKNNGLSSELQGKVIRIRK